MINKKEFSKVLLDKNLTQVELARKMGVSINSLNSWVNNKRSPRLEIVAKMCEILDINDGQTMKKIFLLYPSQKCND